MPMSQEISVVLRHLERYWSMCEHVICCSQVGKCEIQRVQGNDGFFLFPCSKGLIEENQSDELSQSR